jgi:hypothetical protein
MKMKKVEFLKSVNIREAWSKEDRDFTPWVAQTDVLQELFDQCDIELGTDYEIRTEVLVPGIKRKLDILITSESGERIAVENQFSTIDHDHLTRALMYAVGLNAKTVIVIAESHRPEFVALAEYLNGAAKAYEDEGISLFLVEIEVLTSPGSEMYHPRFDVVCRPDEWRAAVFQATHHADTSTERNGAVFNFHEQLLPLLREKTGIFKNVVASYGSWKAGSFGIASVQVKYDVAKENVAVQLWLHRNEISENQAGFAYLQQHKSEIERLFEGRQVNWRSQNTSIIEVRVPGIGWGLDPSPGKTAEMVETVSTMVSIAVQHKEAIRQAISQAREE